MNITDMAKTTWGNDAISAALAIQVKAYLDACPDDTQLSTSGLLRGMGVAFDQMKAIVTHLGNARRAGLLERYYTRDEKHKSFGHANVLWHQRRAMTNDERIAQLKADGIDV